MPKIYKRNKKTPKRKKRPNWSYNTIQGGKRTNFKFPESDSAIGRMKDHLTNYNRWKRYPGPHPEGRGSRAYTIVTLIPAHDIIKVHSLFFPNGVVWDSTIRDFRKIRDYELEQK